MRSHISSWYLEVVIVTHFSKPVIQCQKLLITQHSMGSCIILLSHIRTITAGVQDEERGVAIAEIVVVLALMRRIIVRFSVVQLEGVRSTGERRLRVVPLSDIVVDNLGTVSI